MPCNMVAVSLSTLGIDSQLYFRSQIGIQALINIAQQVLGDRVVATDDWSSAYAQYWPNYDVNAVTQPALADLVDNPRLFLVSVIGSFQFSPATDTWNLRDGWRLGLALTPEQGQEMLTRFAALLQAAYPAVAQATIAQFLGTLAPVTAVTQNRGNITLTVEV